MLLKTLQVSDVPALDQVHEISTSSPFLPKTLKSSNFTVIGHRGNGMNSLSSTNPTMENSILSFNKAGKFPIQFIEFDVQVTSDDHPIIFHDSFILAKNKGEKRVTDLSLNQFLSYNSKALLRKTHDGEILDWSVENHENPLCTLQEAFLKVDPHLGFNIELKFDDEVAYKDEELIHSLQIVLNCVYQYSGDRKIIFSSFSPDAARLVRGLQNLYPVFFLTDGGVEIYGDDRRNSLEEAVKLCRECGLQGIVSEVRALMRKPSVISEVREAGLGLMSYGKLNNIGEIVWLQNLMGIDGVIVDRVQEITEVVSGFAGLKDEGREDEGKLLVGPRFSQVELEFVLKLIPELAKGKGC
ncbi:uncharacterized protein A4U43_C07F26890 [Asparagus officinalis]|uniref:glycerophosphodiester phosphodiesterase n=1 Tax=Asparagus officinalis TaxID=4686 RepID=A0A5P1EH40_ASPOF|nr:glycerophosphodiester phosphodiesterase GDPD2-like [Asparagus officinalis]ONK64517.1 uncharacterized protein A4U43_C07F26890 [Asparagus officinalis]